MKYISLFSGIGGFEIAIQNIFPLARCIGYSEVEKFALQVYQSHYPNHPYLGDITSFQKEQIQRIVHAIKGCNLLVGGFPCKNLTSLARQNKHCNLDCFGR